MKRALASCAAPEEDMNAAEEPAEATVRYQETVGRVTTEQTHVATASGSTAKGTS